MENNMLPNYQIKGEARAALRGKTFTVAGMLALLAIISLLSGQLVSLMVPGAQNNLLEFSKSLDFKYINLSVAIYYLLTMIIEFILVPAQIGVSKYTLEINRVKKVEAPFDMLLAGYKKFNYVMRMIIVHIIKGIAVAVGLVFFIIPGIYLSLALSMTPYLLIEEPELTISEVLKKSIRLMKGRNIKLFMLYLSLLGHLLLVLITFGLWLLWLVPYTYTIQGKFYDEICKSMAPPGPPSDEGFYTGTFTETEIDPPQPPEVFTDI